MPDLADSLRLAPEQLRWSCDPTALPFETTAEVEPLEGFVGQEDAVEALSFGLATYAQGQNVYVRGLPETGRLTLVRRVLATLPRACPEAPDHLYVHDFEAPDQPRLLTVPRGRGRELEERLERFTEFLRRELGPALNDENLRKRRETLDERLEKDLQKLRAPFEAELKEAGLALVSATVGQQVRTMILPVVEGEPQSPEKLQELVAQEKLTDADVAQLEERVRTHAKKLNEVAHRMQERQREHGERLRRLVQDEARQLVDEELRPIRERFDQPAVRAFLDECVAEVVRRGLPSDEAALETWLRRFRPNLVHCGDADDPCPVVVESTPTLGNLLGGIERRILPGGAAVSDHLMISGGALLRANGGYLVLEARDVLSEPGAWKVLVRTLRSGLLEIVPSELQGPWGGRTIKPDPIPIQVKVVLIGGPDLYYALDAGDPDFAHLFKVLADFDSVLPRGPEAVDAYARFVARLVSKEPELPHFHRSGVARLAEHGARIAGRNDRLTARFGRLADIAREAAFVARQAGAELVDAEHVHTAILRTRRRANLPARKYRENITDGTINIEVEGRRVGQVNGLAVLSAGPLTFGFPSRITATIGAGLGGAVDIERESQLSGRIHTKGFHILQGLLRYLLQTQHPLAFTASLAFEQSYGGIDGDSASGAEMCCMLSALTDVPLRQDLAMTGAIDQHGRVQAIGGVSEKTEGFFATCRDLGLTGTQGVIVPRANVRDLMLDEEVVAACREGRFHVYAVETIQQALEVFTGVPAGERGEDGEYPVDSILGRAVDQAYEYWSLASARPDLLTPAGVEETVTDAVLSAERGLPAGDEGAD